MGRSPVGVAMGVSGDAQRHSALQKPSLPQAQQPDSEGAASAAVEGPPGGRHCALGLLRKRQVPGAHGFAPPASDAASCPPLLPASGPPPPLLPPVPLLPFPLLLALPPLELPTPELPLPLPPPEPSNPELPPASIDASELSPPEVADPPQVAVARATTRQPRDAPERKRMVDSPIALQYAPPSNRRRD
jgi:hypothetical protein